MTLENPIIGDIKINDREELAGKAYSLGQPARRGYVGDAVPKPLLKGR